MAQDKRKAELTADLTRARSRIAQNVVGVRKDLNFSGRMQKAVKKNPAYYIGGAALVGVLLSMWPKRGKKTVVLKTGKEAPAVSAGKAGLVLGAMKIAFDLSRPALMKWARGRVGDYMQTRRADRRVSR